MSLPTAFASLSVARSTLPPETYVVERVEAPQETYLACSADGRPALFVVVAMGDGPGVRLRNMEMRHRVTGNLRTYSFEAITGTYTLVECLSHDVRLQQAFLELAADILRRSTPWATSAELEIDFRLVEFFTAATMPSAASWLGTWGELFLMHSASAPERLLACWRVDPMRLHDFALGAERLRAAGWVVDREHMPLVIPSIRGRLAAAHLGRGVSEAIVGKCVRAGGKHLVVVADFVGGHHIVPVLLQLKNSWA